MVVIGRIGRLLVIAWAITIDTGVKAKEEICIACYRSTCSMTIRAGKAISSLKVHASDFFWTGSLRRCSL